VGFFEVDKRAATLEAPELRRMMLHIGPSHPAMHGIVQIDVELEGETIKRADIEIGYLHRCFEKMSETVVWNNVFPYTDRLNYVSPLINNVGYAMAVEKLLGIQTTERCQWIRVMMSEVSRITDHLTCIGASAMELGAFTVFLYLIEAREYLWETIEELTGARLTISYVRVGGVKADLPEGFEDRMRVALRKTREKIDLCDKLLTRNRIFVDRMETGQTSAEFCRAWGITGPWLRSSGVDYDVRKDFPHLVYDEVDFDVPVGTRGDNYDRYLVRMEEMRQSIRIVEQCLAKMPKGELNVDHEGKVISASKMKDLGAKGATAGLVMDYRVDADPTLHGAERDVVWNVRVGDRLVSLPPKEDVYGSIEGLINHFKLVMSGHGIQPPAGEAYHAVEGGNGELGFYVVSNGEDRAWRVRVRPPCFTIMSALGKVLEGCMVADIVPTFGAVNMIGGELDR
jgi:NADH-quinone oxidoreductase subunit D